MEPGPKLPVKTEEHCMLKMDTNVYMLTGGEDNELNTWMYSFDTENWVEGPSFSTKMDDHACGFIIDKMENTGLAVVAGILLIL